MAALVPDEDADGQTGYLGKIRRLRHLSDEQCDECDPPYATESSHWHSWRKLRLRPLQ
jgi:hypothetical protein